MNSDYILKKNNLIFNISKYTSEDIIIAFSGGVDSSLLLKIACSEAKKKNKKVYAVTLYTELHPMKDINIAKKVAKEAGAEHLIININELKEAGIINNPKNRCYLCKKFLFLKVKEVAEILNVKIILEGTNEDDLKKYRPGIKALKELGIISPLAENKINKSYVRKMADEYNISVSQRPSTPCLATRFPYGTKLSYRKIRKVEKAEDYISTLIKTNLRVRVHDNIVRIEVDDKSLKDIILNRKDIVNYMKTLGYDYITLDMEGFRSGSMDCRINV